MTFGFICKFYFLFLTMLYFVLFLAIFFVFLELIKIEEDLDNEK